MFTIFPFGNAKIQRRRTRRQRGPSDYFDKPKPGASREIACGQAMEPQNLEAASNYINNVLLARGLLKGGKSIDFAQPDNDEGGADATMAKIINLVNDLVLRRDVCRMLLGGRRRHD